MATTVAVLLPKPLNDHVPSSRPSRYHLWDRVNNYERGNECCHLPGYQHQQAVQVAEMHGVPRTTLNDHVLGKVLPGAKYGAPTVLSTSEEQDLVDFLIKSASIGCGRTRKD